MRVVFLPKFVGASESAQNQRPKGASHFYEKDATLNPSSVCASGSRGELTLAATDGFRIRRIPYQADFVTIGFRAGKGDRINDRIRVTKGRT